jgi:serine/threonine protein kinase
MEFVDGINLQKRIAGVPQEPNSSAQLLETVARAVHWIHQRGIIHRDLKPANILLFSGGVVRGALVGDTTVATLPLTAHHSPLTPKITDFGLAKRLDSQDGQTKTGDILGTPGYMAPEQVRAKSAPIGPCTDVYALGAILYEMLTGHAPFRGETPWETIDMVLTKEPVPPRILLPNVSRDLETICLKCLQKEPGRRYSSAGELADDLGRFLRQESIHARPVSRWEKAVRWGRRERKVATLLGVTLAVVILSTLVISGIWLHMKRQADAAFENDLRDLQDQLSSFNQEEFILSPQMDQWARKRLEQLAERCQTLASSRGDSLELRRKKAEVDLHLGSIRELLGQYQGAESAYREALALHDRISTDRRHYPQDDQAQARCQYQMANLLMSIGRFDEATSRYQQALAIQELLESSGNADSRSDLADTLQKLAGLQARTGHFAEAEQMYRRALLLQQQLVDEQPAVAARQLNLAQTETGLASLLTMLARFGEAEPLFKAAIGRQEKLVGASANVPVYKLGLARSLSSQAHMLAALNRQPASVASLRRAYEIVKKLAEDNPHRPDYRVDAASALFQVARDGSPESIYLRYLNAVAEQERLAAQFPAHIENRRRLAVTLDDVATFCNDYSTYQKHALPALLLLAQALEFHSRSHAIWSQLAADYPAVLAFQNGLAVSDQRYGISLERWRQWDRAESGFRRALASQETLAQKYPNLEMYWIRASALTTNLGVIFDQHKKDLPEAEKLFRLGIALIEKAKAINPLNPTTQVLLSMACENLGKILYRQKRYQEAAPQYYAAGIAYDHAWYTCEHFFRELNSCASKAANDASLDSVMRSELVHQYEDWTIELLKRMMANADNDKRGVDALALLKRWPSLEFVRQRDEYRDLLRDAEKKHSKPQ